MSVPHFDVGTVGSTARFEVISYLLRQAAGWLEENAYVELEGAIHLLAELAMVIHALAQSDKPADQHIAHTLLAQLAYENELVDLLVRLFKDFKPTQQSRAALGDLVLLAAAILHLFRDFSQKEGVVVARKAPAKRKKKTGAAATEEEREEERAVETGAP
ncbi:hypothetical protein PAPYR_6213 [Paratrimastix pyriformis]|uniref:Uncharacterized protein n=1 Tax=Paratrimastix pyriformis TaxID=342808 RepID=A0ABQ8UMX3_9EUKA|nr:hypothetical protein PAPYR_6213 [Paratrimastix pyriformis]